MSSSTFKKTTIYVTILLAVAALVYLCYYLFSDPPSMSDSSDPKPVVIDSPGKLNYLLESVDTILADCDGVLYVGGQAINGTPSVLNRLRAMGKKILFASNTSTRSRRTVLNDLTRMGFNASLDEILVTTYLVAVYLSNQNFQGRVYVLGGDGLKEELDLAGIDNIGVEYDPDDTRNFTGLVPLPVPLDPNINAVVVGYDKNVNLAKLIRAVSYASRVESHLFIATNMDDNFLSEQRDLLVPGSGPFVEFVKTATRREPVVVGKPSKTFWESIVEAHPQIVSNRTLMIGDQMKTDIAFGNQNNLRATLLVGTGGLTLEDARNQTQADLIPDFYIDSLASFSNYLAIPNAEVLQ